MNETKIYFLTILSILSIVLASVLIIGINSKITGYATANAPEERKSGGGQGNGPFNVDFGQPKMMTKIDLHTCFSHKETGDYYRYVISAYSKGAQVYTTKNPAPPNWFGGKTWTKKLGKWKKQERCHDLSIPLNLNAEKISVQVEVVSGSPSVTTSFTVFAQTPTAPQQLVSQSPAPQPAKPPVQQTPTPAPTQQTPTTQSSGYDIKIRGGYPELIIQKGKPSLSYQLLADTPFAVKFFIENIGSEKSDPSAEYQITIGGKEVLRNTLPKVLSPGESQEFAPVIQGIPETKQGERIMLKVNLLDKNLKNKYTWDLIEPISPQRLSQPMVHIYASSVTLTTQDGQNANLIVVPDHPFQLHFTVKNIGVVDAQPDYSVEVDGKEVFKGKVPFVLKPNEEKQFEIPKQFTLSPREIGYYIEIKSPSSTIFVKELVRTMKQQLPVATPKPYQDPFKRELIIAPGLLKMFQDGKETTAVEIKEGVPLQVEFIIKNVGRTAYRPFYRAFFVGGKGIEKQVPRDIQPAEDYSVRETLATTPLASHNNIGIELKKSAVENFENLLNQNIVVQPAPKTPQQPIKPLQSCEDSDATNNVVIAGYLELRSAGQVTYEGDKTEGNAIIETFCEKPTLSSVKTRKILCPPGTKATIIELLVDGQKVSSAKCTQISSQLPLSVKYLKLMQNGVDIKNDAVQSDIPLTLDFFVQNDGEGDVTPTYTVKFDGTEFFGKVTTLFSTKDRKGSQRASVSIPKQLIRIGPHTTSLKLDGTSFDQTIQIKVVQTIAPDFVQTVFPTYYCGKDVAVGAKCRAEGNFGECRETIDVRSPGAKRCTFAGNLNGCTNYGFKCKTSANIDGYCAYIQPPRDLRLGCREGVQK